MDYKTFHRLMIGASMRYDYCLYVHRDNPMVAIPHEYRLLVDDEGIWCPSNAGVFNNNCFGIFWKDMAECEWECYRAGNTTIVSINKERYVIKLYRMVPLESIDTRRN